jgi:hypothetical protein
MGSLWFRLPGAVFAAALVCCTANAATVLSDEIRLCAVGLKKVCDADMVLKDTKGNPALQLIVEAETSGADVPFPAPVIVMSAPVAAYVASSVYMTEVQDGVVVASDIVSFGFILPPPGAKSQMVNIGLRSASEAIKSYGVPPAGSTTVAENGDFQDLTALLFAKGPAPGFSVWTRSDVETPEPASWTLIGTGLLGVALVRKRRSGI